MGLISRVSSRTYRFFCNPHQKPSTNPQLTLKKWLTENPEPSSAETYPGAPPKTCSSRCPNSRTRPTSKSQPTEKPAGHEDSASSSSTPLKSANKLWRVPKV